MKNSLTTATADPYANLDRRAILDTLIEGWRPTESGLRLMSPLMRAFWQEVIDADRRGESKC